MAIILSRMDDPEELMLVRASADEPDDDLPRFAYSDWLEKNGQLEQAELIRHQIRLFKPPHPSEADWDRETELLGGEDPRAVAHRWFPELPTVMGATVFFGRGFPESLHINGPITDMPGLATLFRELPITSVRACGFNSLAPMLRVAADGFGLRHLSADADRDAPDFASYLGAFSFLDEDYVAGLTWLDLYGYWLDPADVGAIGRLCRRGRIRRLTLTSAALTPTNVAAVLPAAETMSLRFLDLSENGLRDDGAAAVAQCPGLRGLYRLDLSSNGIGPDGVEALANSPYLAGLKELDLQNNPLGTIGGRRLAAGPSLGSVRRLSVQHCGVGHLWKSLRSRFETVELR